MNLIMYTITSVSYVIVEPYLMMILILLGIAFYRKNRKVVAMQRMVIGDEVNSALELTLSQIVLGILAGMLASIVLSYLGVIFDENSGISALFLISILLMLIKPRLVCFSYSGAILGVVSLIFTYLNITTSDGVLLFNLDITMLMTFIGVLHIIEGILVMFDGPRGAVPVFSNKKGRIVGGYALKRHWLIPVAIFIAYSGVTKGSIGTQTVGTPNWWPILSYEDVLNLIENAVLTLVPFFGVIGYSSLTFTRSKRGKAVSSGLFILVYGMLLMGVAQLASLGIGWEIFAIIYAPLSHEGMLLVQRIIEDKRAPLFVSGDDGVAILDVVPFSKAYEIGLRAGDKILTANNSIINNEADIYVMLKENYNRLNLKIKDRLGNIKELSLRHENNKRLGIVLVPRFVDMEKVISFENNKFQDVLKKVKEKDKDK